MQKQTNSFKNAEIELYRVLMIFSIAILHFSEDYMGTSGILPGGYLGVDFCFIISGYFLMCHFEKEYVNEKSAVLNTIKYFVGRTKKLYPPYLLAVLGMTIITWGINGFGIKRLLINLWDTRWQYLFLHFLGASTGFSMRSIWYMSSFMILSYLIYFLLSYNQELYMGIAPIISILLLVFISRTYGSLNMQGEYIVFFNGGFIRGFSDMTIGVFIRKLACLDLLKTKSKRGQCIHLLTRIASWIIVFYIIKFKGFDGTDFSVLPAMAMLIFLSVKYPLNFYRTKKVWIFLGQISYWFFLIHLLVSTLMQHFFAGNNYYIMLVIYLIITIIVSALLNSFFQKN